MAGLKQPRIFFRVHNTSNFTVCTTELNDTSDCVVCGGDFTSSISCVIRCFSLGQWRILWENYVFLRLKSDFFVCKALQYYKDKTSLMLHWSEKTYSTNNGPQIHPISSIKHAIHH